MADSTSEPHQRWSRATDTQFDDAKRRLLGIARARKLLGSVTADDVSKMTRYDLLDLAAAAHKAGEGDFTDILNRARTPGYDPFKTDKPAQ